jgi:hypothetical protein
MKKIMYARILCALALLTLAACGGGNVGTGGSTTNNPPGTLNLGQAQYSISQDGQMLAVSVSRTSGDGAAVGVSYATSNGTAIAGTDYTATQGSLSWASGDSAAKSFNIPVSNAQHFTGSKTLSIALSNVTGGALLGSPNVATATITGVAAPPPGALQFSAASYTVAQGAGTVTLTVDRVGGTAGAVAVSYASSNGTAVAGTDYSAASGTLSWADGDAAAKTFAVPISATTPFSGTKNFTVALANATGGATLGSPNSATVSITGSGVSNPGVVAFSSSSFTVLQSAGQVAISVSRTGGSSGAASVHYATSDGTAHAGTDYSAASGTLSWADGDAAAKSLSVPVSNSTPYSGIRTFNLQLSSASGATLGSPSSATVSETGSSGTTGTSGQITVNAASTIAPITANQFGTNLGIWYNMTQNGATAAAAVQAVGAHLVRWPGGSNGNQYHWATNTMCKGAYASPGSGFDTFMQKVIVPTGSEVALTVNYGSNIACTGGGDPNEAAAWVADVVSKHYNVHHYTVGNEQWGSWEYDLHAIAHDPLTYATAVGTSTSGGYYQLMKAQDPTAQIGVVVANQAGWDSIVLSKAQFDFVELHSYFQAPGAESDSFLLTLAPAQLTASIKALRTELAALGHASTPIYLGEFNTVFTNPGKQSLSVVNGLFVALAFGELLNDAVPMNTWFMGIGAGCAKGADSAIVAAGLYGWQNFGAYDQVSEGWSAGSCASGSQAVPAGTVLPSGYGEQLASSFAVAGNSMLAATVASSLTNVRAYAATQGSGFSLMLINVDENAGATVTVGVSNTAKTSFAASTVTYGKAQYDDSKINVWTAPVSQSLGTVAAPVSVTLPPWSITILKLQ